MTPAAFTPPPLPSSTLDFNMQSWFKGMNLIVRVEHQWVLLQKKMERTLTNIVCLADLFDVPTSHTSLQSFIMIIFVILVLFSERKKKRNTTSVGCFGSADSNHWERSCLHSSSASDKCLCNSHFDSSFLSGWLHHAREGTLALRNHFNSIEREHFNVVTRPRLPTTTLAIHFNPSVAD